MTSERQKISILFVLIIVLGFIAGSIFTDRLPTWWPGYYWFARFRTHLGLDLQGGAHLIYEADTSQVDINDAEVAIAGVRDVIEKRVNALGVSEPVVQTSRSGGRLRVIVELAGVFDVNKAIEQIGATPLLEFKVEATPPPVEPIGAEEKAKREEFNSQQFKKTQDTINRIVASQGQNFVQVAQEVSEDPGTAKSGGDLGFVARGLLVPEFEAVLFDQLKDGEMAIEPVQTQFGYHIIQRLESKEEKDSQTGQAQTLVRGRQILFMTKSLTGDVPQYDPWTNTNLSGKQLKRSEVQYEQLSGTPTIGLVFDDEGASLFEQITGDNVGKRVAIFLDGSLLSAPVVQQKISGGQAVITGNFTIPEARQLVERLNAGALPMPINLVGQRTVGPSLGAASLQKSLVAGLAGFLLVAIFMLIIYRLAGLLAVISLLFYGAIVFSLFKLVPITLTLAGIAGFLLSMGMAVDANVLIFERLKEELKNGESFGRAVSEGFSRAWSSIRDSNISTLLTCLILAWFGTSIIKGFAITLGLGILVSMFSGIVITRVLIEVVARVKWLRGKRWLWGG